MSKTDGLESIGQYKILESLEPRALGPLYRARDLTAEGREVAIQVCATDEVATRQQFLREAGVAAGLEHPNIAAVLATGEEGGTPFYVEDRPTGRSLEEFLGGGQTLERPRVVEILRQVAAALAYAHGRGVLHRDLRPANVRQTEDGKILVQGFALGRLASSEAQGPKKGAALDAAYLAPEQVRGGEADTRTDVFAFGVLAYELLTGERPFQGNTLSALVYQILYKVPMPVQELWPECPQALQDLVGRCLEKKPERRWAEFGELMPLLGLKKGPQTVSAVAAEAPLTMKVPIVPPREPAGERPVPAGSARGEAKAGEVAVPQAPGSDTAEIPFPEVAEADDDSTKPIPIVELGEASGGKAGSKAPGRQGATSVKPPDPPGEAEVGRSTLPAMPAVQAPGAEEVANQLAEEGLASRGHEIGSLVAKGRLTEAMRELTATVEEHRTEEIRTTEPIPVQAESAGSEAAPPAKQGIPKPPPVIPPTGSARPGKAVPGVPAPGTGAAKKSGAADPRAAVQGTAVTTPAGQGDSPPAVTPPPKAQSDTRASKGLPTALLAMVAVAALGVLLLIWFWPRPKAPEPPVETPVVVQPVPQPEAPALVSLGQLAVDGAPWGRLVEILDSDGQALTLPAVTTTPLVLDLPPGTYRLRVEGPGGEAPVSPSDAAEEAADVDAAKLTSDEDGQEQGLASDDSLAAGSIAGEVNAVADTDGTCWVLVQEAAVSSCQAVFAEPDLTSFFKESGWWS